MIPKIIWQTYETSYDELDPTAKIFSNSWKNLNPSWEYRYASNKERINFIKTYFDEEWYLIYTSYKLNVMRADLWRYMCLYIYGGLYCDLDMLCKLPIESWLNTEAEFVVSKEPNVPGYTQMIFASGPKNVILKNLLFDIKEKFYKKTPYLNVIDYATNETGYSIFTDSILKTLKTHTVNFIDLVNKEAEHVHYEATEHYHAGHKPVFGNSYIKWRHEKI
jgi:mannosyltransferase OCH1-like enzyme